MADPVVFDPAYVANVARQSAVMESADARAPQFLDAIKRQAAAMEASTGRREELVSLVMCLIGQSKAGYSGAAAVVADAAAIQAEIDKRFA